MYVNADRTNVIYKICSHGLFDCGHGFELALLPPLVVWGRRRLRRAG